MGSGKTSMITLCLPEIARYYNKKLDIIKYGGSNLVELKFGGLDSDPIIMMIMLVMMMVRMIMMVMMIYSMVRIYLKEKNYQSKTIKKLEKLLVNLSMKLANEKGVLTLRKNL